MCFQIEFSTVVTWHVIGRSNLFGQSLSNLLTSASVMRVKCCSLGTCIIAKETKTIFFKGIPREARKHLQDDVARQQSPIYIQFMLKSRFTNFYFPQECDTVQTSNTSYECPTYTVFKQQ